MAVLLSGSKPRVSPAAKCVIWVKARHVHADLGGALAEVLLVDGPLHFDFGQNALSGIPAEPQHRNKRAKSRSSSVSDPQQGQLRPAVARTH